jgi:hypothetical protein
MEKFPKNKAVEIHRNFQRIPTIYQQGEMSKIFPVYADNFTFPHFQHNLLQLLPLQYIK